jgi:effector-binding domain-containing protein
VLQREQVPEAVPACLATVFKFLRKHRIPVSGAPLIRYLLVDYNSGGIEVDVGVPIGVAVPADPQVYSAQIRSGTFATLIHHGPYEALVETTAALMDWARQNKVNWMMAEEHKVTRWEGRVEHYLVRPPDEPNPSRWQTEIAILISVARH